MRMPEGQVVRHIQITGDKRAYLPIATFPDPQWQCSSVLFLVLSAYNTNGAPVGFDSAALEDPLSPDSCKSQLK